MTIACLISVHCVHVCLMQSFWAQVYLDTIAQPDSRWLGRIQVENCVRDQANAVRAVDHGCFRDAPGLVLSLQRAATTTIYFTLKTFHTNQREDRMLWQVDIVCKTQYPTFNLISPRSSVAYL